MLVRQYQQVLLPNLVFKLDFPKVLRGLSFSVVGSPARGMSFQSPTPRFALGFRLHCVYFSCSLLSFRSSTCRQVYVQICERMNQFQQSYSWKLKWVSFVASITVSYRFPFIIKQFKVLSARQLVTIATL